MRVFASSLIAVAVALGAPKEGAEPLTLSTSFVTNASTRELAQAVLPPQVAVRVAGHKLHPPVLHNVEGYTARFWEHTTAFGPGFCQRYLWVVPMGQSTRGRLQPGNPSPGAELKMAEDCSTATEPFIHLNRTHNLLAVEYLKWFKKLHEDAASSGDLDVEIECRSDVQPDPCASGARQVLARLPLERASILEQGGGRRRREADWHLSFSPSDVPNHYWRVSVFDWSTPRARVQLSWGMIPPF